MKQCNNCSSLNEDHVLVCSKCSMKGNFSPVLRQTKTDKDDTIKSLIHSCPNCGAQNNNHVVKCQSCHFPLASRNTEISESPIQRKTNML